MVQVVTGYSYGRQGLAGSWGQDTDEVSTFLVFFIIEFDDFVEFYVDFYDDVVYWI